MSITDRVRAAARAFKLGSALDISTPYFGVDPSTYTPAEYGDYLATSNGVYACANKRAKLLSSLPLGFYRVDSQGEKTEVTRGNVAGLFGHVNPYWTLNRLMQMTELSLCLWGSAFWFLERGRSGMLAPKEIWWGRSDKVTVFPHETEYVAKFEYEAGNGQRIPFLPSEVIWFRYPNPLNEFSGLSPLAAARLSADLGSAALKSNRNIFANGLQIGGAVIPAKGQTLTADQAREIELQLERRFKGVDKAHRWGVFRFEAQMQQVGFTPKDVEFLGALNWTLADIARAYDVPLDLIGGQRTYENVNAAMKAMWSYCVLPEASFIASEITEQLLPMFGREADVAEFDSSGIAELQEDRSEVVTQIDVLAQRGVPINALLQEFMPALLPKGQQGYPWGDVWWTSATMTPIENAEPRPAPEPVAPPADVAPLEEDEADELPAPERSRAYHVRAVEYGGDEHRRLWTRFTRRTDRYERMVADTVNDLFRRQRDSVLARLGVERSARAGVADEPFSLKVWIKTFRTEMRPVFQRILSDVGAEALDDIGVTGAFNTSNPAVIRFLEGRAQRFAQEVNDTTWRDLQRVLGEGIESGESTEELAARVRDLFGRYIGIEPDAAGKMARAWLIARTEANGAANGGTWLAWQQSEVVTGKEWLAALDDRTRDDHVEAHGQIVGRDEDFVVGGVAGPMPGMMGDAGQDCGCRCTARAVLEGE